MRKGEIFQRVNLSETEYEQLKRAERKVTSTKVLKRIQAFKLMYHGWKYSDIARYNYAKATRACAEENNILLLFLPPYAPTLNIIERLRKFSKKHLVNNTYHKEFGKFFDAAESFFNNLDEYHQELTSLLTQKFQIIHAE